MVWYIVYRYCVSFVRFLSHLTIFNEKNMGWHFAGSFLFINFAGWTL